MFESNGFYQGKILVSKDKDYSYLVEGDEELMKGMDGLILEDNDFRNVPEKPGIYLCRIEFFFSQGYFEGHIADGESEWYYEIQSAVLMEEPAIAARLKELEERHEADAKKIAAEAEKNNLLQASFATAKERCLKVTEWFQAVIKERVDLPAGFAPQILEQIRLLYAVLSDEHGWSRYYQTEFDDLERHSLSFDIQQIAKKVLGMEIKENEYVSSWQIVGNLEHRMKMLKQVLEAGQAARDAYMREGAEVAGAIVNSRVVPAVEAFEAAFERVA